MDLPPELWISIFSFLHYPRDLSSVRLVSSTFSRLLSDSRLIIQTKLVIPWHWLQHFGISILPLSMITLQSNPSLIRYRLLRLPASSITIVVEREAIQLQLEEKADRVLMDAKFDLRWKASLAASPLQRPSSLTNLVDNFIHRRAYKLWEVAVHDTVARLLIETGAYRHGVNIDGLYIPPLLVDGILNVTCHVHKAIVNRWNSLAPLMPVHRLRWNLVTHGYLFTHYKLLEGCYLVLDGVTLPMFIKELNLIRELSLLILCIDNKAVEEYPPLPSFDILRISFVGVRNKKRILSYLREYGKVVV